MKSLLLGLLLFCSTVHAQVTTPAKAGAKNFKTSVANPASLPLTGNTAGDSRVSISNSSLYIWDGAAWQGIVGGGASVWGAITGTLSNQTDLNTALGLKEPTITATTSADYYRGDKTFQTLNTTAVPEGTNLYFTNGRFDTRFGLKTTTDLAEGTNLYYTQGRFDTAFTAKDTDDLSEGATNLYFTNGRAQSAVVTQAITDGVLTTSPSENEIFDALALKQSASEKDQNNGYAGLDAGGKIAISALPNTVMTFEGQWNANTNTPALADGVGNAGDVWRANVAGTTNFGSGAIVFNLGDWAVYNGTIWEYAANSNLVMSVNGQQGVVVLTTTNIAEGTNLYFTDARAIAAPITGFTSGAGVLSATDTILQAINKLDGNIGAASTGTANKFAGFDSSGDLNPISSWTQNAFGGVDEQNTYTIASAAGNVKLNTFESESDPTSAITGTNIYGSFFDMHVGRLTSGFGTDGGLTALNSSFQLANDGTYNNTNNINLIGAYGDGVGGSSTQSHTIDSFDQFNTGFTTGDYRFLNGEIKNNGTITNENDFNFQSNGDNTNNYSGFQMSKLGNVGGGATGYRFDLNSAVTGTVYGFSSVLQGTGSQVEAINLSSSQNLSGTYFGINSSYTGNTATNSYLINGATSGTSQATYGLNFNNNGATDYYNGVSLQNNANGIHHSALNYNNSGDQSGSGQIIDIQSSGDADSETGLNINLTGAYNNVSGININVGSATSVNQPVAFNSSGGAFNSYSPYSTANYTPAGVFIMNSLGGVLDVASGHPISGGDFGFGANLASVMQFNDDMGPDSTTLGLGFVDVGFVGQLAIASGKTVDSINMALGGAGVPGSGGTVTNFSNFRALGTLNQGGSITVTNMYGFRTGSPLCSMATNCWGFFSDDPSADNYFAKNVVIGGVTGQPESGIELDVTGDVRLRGLSTAGYVTTDASGHLSSVAIPSSPVSANITANTTLAAATARYYLGDTTGGAFTVTLPAAASNDGVAFTVKHTTFGGANDITIATGETIDGEAGDTLTAGEGKTYISNGTAWFTSL